MKARSASTPELGSFPSSHGSCFLSEWGTILGARIRLLSILTRARAFSQGPLVDSLQLGGHPEPLQ